MAFEYGFYNSINGDRKYNALDFGKVFDGVITDGVFAGIGDKMFVTRGAGSFEILVGTGKAWFDHTWNLNTSPMLFTLSGSHPVLTRYDAVVLEVNETQDVYGRVNEIKVIEGTPSSNAVKPTLLNTDNLHQHPLAYIKINPEVTEITAQDIEIVVGQSACPFVTSVLQQTDITELFANWNDQFNTWFDNLKAQLTDNVVTNLQNQINNCLKVTDIATSEDIIAGTPGKVISADNFKTAGLDVAYKIGDMVSSYRKGLGPNWALCNGARFDKDEYPELAALMPPKIKDKFLSPYNKLIPIATIPQESGNIMVGAPNTAVTKWPSNTDKQFTPSVTDQPPIVGDKYILFTCASSCSYTSGSSNVTDTITTLVALDRETLEQKFCPTNISETIGELKTNSLFNINGIYIKERGEFLLIGNSGKTLLIKESDIDNSPTKYRFTCTMFNLPTNIIGSGNKQDITYQNGFAYCLKTSSTSVPISYYISKIDLDNRTATRVADISNTFLKPSDVSNNPTINSAYFLEDKVLFLLTNMDYISYAPAGTPPFKYFYYSVVSYLYGVSSVSYPLYIGSSYRDINNSTTSTMYKINNKIFAYIYTSNGNSANRKQAFYQYIFDTLPTSETSIPIISGAPDLYRLVGSGNDLFLNAWAIMDSSLFVRSTYSPNILEIPISGINNPSNSVINNVMFTPTDYSHSFAASQSGVIKNPTERWYSNTNIIPNNLDNAFQSSVSSICYDDKREEFIVWGVVLTRDYTRLTENYSYVYGIYIVSKYALPCIQDGLYTYIKVKDS